MKKIILLTILLISSAISVEISPQMIESVKSQYGISDSQVRQAAEQVLEGQGTQQTAPQNNFLSSPKELSYNEEVLEKSEENEDNSSELQKNNLDGGLVHLTREDFKPSVSMKFPSNLKYFGYDVFNQVAMSFTPLSNIPVAGDYIIGPGDELKIYLWGNIQQNFSLVVDSSGDILLPRAGKVNVANLSLDQAKKIIEEEMKKHFANFTMDITMGQLKTMEVFILGEVKTPGRYNVNSLSSVIYALYYSGGPTKLGSLRNIKLIRNNKTIKSFDLYKLLLHGDKSDDILLRPGDTIFVPKVGERVAVIGQVKSPAIFELKGSTTLSGLFEMAGNYNRKSYIKEINIIRKDQENDQFALKTLSFPTWADFLALSQRIVVNDGDIVEIKSISDHVNNWIQINGNVRFPGLYSTEKVDNFADILTRSGGFFPDTYLKRANIYRITTDNNYVVIPVDLQDSNLQDIKLNKFDKVVIYKNDDILKEEYISVFGEVYNQGNFMLYDKMSLEDALFFAGSLKLFADKNRIEILRYDRTENVKYLIPVNLNEQKAEDFKLRPFDRIQVNSIDTEYKKETIRISGNVYFPSEINYYENINLKDVLYAAKGLKPFADKSYVTILRKQTSSDEKIITLDLNRINPYDVQLFPFDEIFVRKNPDYDTFGSVTIEGEVFYPGTYPLYKGETLYNLVKRVGGLKKTAFISGIGLFREMKNGQTQKLQETQAQNIVIRNIASLADFNRLRINYQELFEKDSLKHDVQLRAEDRILIPKVPQQIQVIGGVYNAGSFLYSENKNMGYYLDIAGNFRKDADISETFIVHADGTVTKTSDRGVRIKRGDSIIVPTKELKEFDIVKVILDFTQIIFNLTTTWVLILR